MKKKENIHCYEKYLRHIQLLKLQGKSQKTIDLYSRAVRRISQKYDCCPEELTPEQSQTSSKAGGLKTGNRSKRVD